MNRILMIANDFTTLFHFRMELIQKLIQEKYEIFITLPYDKRNSVFKEMGCSLIESNLERFGKNAIKEFFSIREYIALVKKINPHVVLTYTIKPNIYGSIACQLCHTPYINTITGLGIVFQNESFFKKLLFYIQKIALRKSNCIFFQNASNQEYFEKNKIITEEFNTKLLPGSGVNLDLHLYESYPISIDKIKFITISRVRKDKGFDELLEAIRILSNVYNETEFHIVGWIEEDKYKNKIDEMTRDYPIVYHGNRSPEEVHQLLASTHCLIHPSYHEGMSNVILEASATGRPCIVSNIPGCQEAIEDNQTGFLCQVKSLESLQQAIVKFLHLSKEKMKEMGILARRKMEREFDRNIVIDAYMQEITKIMNRKEDLKN